MTMESTVQEALKYTEMEREYRNDKGDNTAGNDFEDFGLPQIKIVGCGGAGNNTINRLYNIGVDGAETIAINTDKQHLDVIKADKKILVGKSLTRGLGAGGFPEIGKRAAELARSTITGSIEGRRLSIHHRRHGWRNGHRNGTDRRTGREGTGRHRRRHGIHAIQG